jgi:PPOX class probable F420-dependent enzyme
MRNDACVAPGSVGSRLGPMDIPPEAQRRIAEDEVAWLTTVTDRGAPAPNPVWFVVDGDDLLVFSEPTARKVHNIERRPDVTLHFNSDRHGGDVVVVSGKATVTHDRPPSRLPAYVDKYAASITGSLGTTVDQIGKTYDTEIRIRPSRIRLTSG